MSVKTNQQQQQRKDPYAHNSWGPFVQGIVHPITVAVVVILMAMVVIVYADAIDKWATSLVRLFFNL